MSRKMFVAAVAASLFAVARAGDQPPPAGGTGGTSAEPKAATPVQTKAEKTKKEKGGTSSSPQPREAPPAPKGEPKQEKPKPCEPVKPCPID
jgi:hypothetical protein